MKNISDFNGFFVDKNCHANVHEFLFIFRETVYLTLKHHRSAGILIILNFFYGTLLFQIEPTEIKLHFLNADIYTHCFIAICVHDIS